MRKLAPIMRTNAKVVGNGVSSAALAGGVEESSSCAFFKANLRTGLDETVGSVASGVAELVNGHSQDLPDPVEKVV